MKKNIRKKKIITLLVVGHRQSKLPSSEEGARLSEKLAELMGMIKTLSGKDELFGDMNEDESFRVLTGISDGTNQLAARISNERKYPLHLLAAGREDEMDEVQSAIASHAERIAFIGASSKDGQLPDEAYVIRDKTSLAFSDILLAIWDPSQSLAGDTAGIILQAAMMLKPVIWLNTDGKIHILDLEKCDKPLLQRLSLPEPYHWLKENFKPLEEGDLEDTLNRLSSPLKYGSKPDDWMLMDYDISNLSNSEKSTAPTKIVNILTACARLELPVAWKNFVSLFHMSHVEHYWGPTKPASDKEHPIAPPTKSLEPAFEKADILATAASSWHRLSQWLLYGFAAIAVLSAIAGHLEILTQESRWSYFEAFLIIAILSIYYLEAKKWRIHPKWIGNRFVAEQLRLARMCLPLLILPNQFYMPAWGVTQEGGKRKLNLENPELWHVQRILIQEGIPQENKNERVYIAREHIDDTAKYIGTILQDQIEYHEKNTSKNVGLHKSLENFSLWLFAITVFVILIHPFIEIEWLSRNVIFITAVFPAIGAAIHGLLTKLEVERTAQQSEKTTNMLKSLQENFANSSGNYPWKEGQEWLDWLRLRQLAIEASRAMSEENIQWQALLRAQGTDLPG